MAYKSYLRFFAPPRAIGKQYLANARQNVLGFIRRDLYDDSGLKCLITAFYDSILGKQPLPIPACDILRTARIMDEVFSQIADGK